MGLNRGKTVIIGDGILAQEIYSRYLEAGRIAGFFVFPEEINDAEEDFEWMDDALETASEATLLVEAIIGSQGRKEEFLEALFASLKLDDAIILSAAVDMSATETGSVSGMKNVVTFSPLSFRPESKLVEIASSLDTPGEVVERVVEFFRVMGKETIEVKDRVGFVLPRILCMLVNEAAYALMEGVATAQDLDTAMKLGMNFPEGPLAWADRIGLGLIHDILLGIQNEQGEERYRVCPLLRQYVLAGWLGEQAGRGFFKYGEGESLLSTLP